MFSWRTYIPSFFGKPRAGSWARVRREHLEKHPSCEACGRAKDLEVHHVKSFSEHPELETDSQNLLTLCGDPCHFVHGHLMGWSRINPTVIEDCRRYREQVRCAR